VEYDNARVLVTDQKLESIKDVLPLLEQLTRVNQPLLIIAEDVTGARLRAARSSWGRAAMACLSCGTHGDGVRQDGVHASVGGGGRAWRVGLVDHAGWQRAAGCQAVTSKAWQSGACDAVTGRLRMRRPGTHGEGPFQEGRRGTGWRARGAAGEALATMVVNKLRGIVNVCAIKAPGFGERRKALLQDIAIVTGAEYIARDLGMKVESAALEQLGTARKVRARAAGPLAHLPAWLPGGLCEASLMCSRAPGESGRCASQLIMRAREACGLHAGHRMTYTLDVLCRVAELNSMEFLRSTPPADGVLRARAGHRGQQLVHAGRGRGEQGGDPDAHRAD